MALPAARQETCHALVRALVQSCHETKGEEEETLCSDRLLHLLPRRCHVCVLQLAQPPPLLCNRSSLRPVLKRRRGREEVAELPVLAQSLDRPVKDPDKGLHNLARRSPLLFQGSQHNALARCVAARDRIHHAHPNSVLLVSTTTHELHRQAREPALNKLLLHELQGFMGGSVPNTHPHCRHPPPDPLNFPPPPHIATSHCIDIHHETQGRHQLFHTCRRLRRLGTSGMPVI
mmetsp:Transcript_18750/g.43047  ORF Transcript_18750/g.43047 Transcript_18750/m.43047 type:complete len:232 (-) Transcript_18750:1049-1744(-)